MPYLSHLAWHKGAGLRRAAGRLENCRRKTSASCREICTGAPCALGGLPTCHWSSPSWPLASPHGIRPLPRTHKKLERMHKRAQRFIFMAAGCSSSASKISCRWKCISSTQISYFKKKVIILRYPDTYGDERHDTYICSTHIIARNSASKSCNFNLREK